MNIIVYKDGLNPADLVVSLNNMCGSLVVDPRPDLKGSYVIHDIKSVQVQPIMRGWIAVAVFSLALDDNRVEIDSSEHATVGFFNEQQELISRRLSPHGENYPIGV